MTNQFTPPATPAGPLPEAPASPSLASGSTFIEYAEAAMGFALIFVSALGLWIALPQ